MRLQTESECLQIVNVLYSRGLDFRDPTSVRPDHGRPSTTDSQDRLLTARSSSTSHDLMRTRSPVPGSLSQTANAMQDLSDPRRSRFEHFVIPSTGERSREQDPSLREPHRESSRFFSRDEFAAPREVSPTRPTTAQLYRHQAVTSRTQSMPYREIDHLHEAKEPAQIPAPPSLRMANSSREAHRTSLRSHREAALDYANSSSTANNPSTSLEPNNKDSSASSCPTTDPRPDSPKTSPDSAYALPDTLQHEVPPRRELPFARPDSSRSDSSRSASRPRSAMTLPPLPKPKLAPRPSERDEPPVMGPPTRPASSSPLKRSFAASNDQAMADTVGEISNSSEGSINNNKLARTIATPPTRKLNGMDELLNSRKPSLSASTSGKLVRMSSLADAPHEEVDPSSDAARLWDAPSDRRDSMSPSKGNGQTDPSHEPGPAGVQDLSLEAFASQTPADRQDALNDFIMANLKNPAFTTLCEEVQNCWRRITLGL